MANPSDATFSVHLTPKTCGILVWAKNGGSEETIEWRKLINRFVRQGRSAGRHLVNE